MARKEEQRNKKPNERIENKYVTTAKYITIVIINILNGLLNKVLKKSQIDFLKSLLYILRISVKIINKINQVAIANSRFVDNPKISYKFIIIIIPFIQES